MKIQTWEVPLQINNTFRSAIKFDFPTPRSWTDFEAKCRRLFKGREGNSECIPYGRAGQNQEGVDFLIRGKNKTVGVSCKLRAEGASLKLSALKKEAVRAVKKFPDMTAYYIVTTENHNTSFEDHKRAILKEMTFKGYNGELYILGKQALQEWIDEDMDAATAFYGDMIATHMASLKEEIKLCRRLLQNNSFQSAVIVAEHFEKIIADSNAEDAKSMLIFIKILKGQALVRLSNEIEAAQSYEAAYNLNPDMMETAAHMIVAKCYRGDPDAIEFGHAQLERWPNEPMIETYLIQAYTFNSNETLFYEIFHQKFPNYCLAAKVEWIKHMRVRRQAAWTDHAIALGKLYPHEASIQRLALEGMTEKYFHKERTSVILPLTSKPEWLAQAIPFMESAFWNLCGGQLHGTDDFIACGLNASYLLILGGEYAKARTILLHVLSHTQDDDKDRAKASELLAISYILEGDYHTAFCTLKPFRHHPIYGKTFVDLINQLPQSPSLIIKNGLAGYIHGFPLETIR